MRTTGWIFGGLLAGMFQARAVEWPYGPAANHPQTEAIHMNDSRFVNWASGYLPPVYGQDVNAVWRTPELALGKAKGNSFDIVCLGNGGSIVIYFPHPIRNGEGPDFAVFENAITHTFLELGFVEVSSDGVNFVRFPNYSETPGPVGAFGMVNPVNIHGFAGKYIQGYGTPFDLEDVKGLPGAASLDLENVRFVRIVDIVGDGSVKDSRGRAIYDPHRTVGSGGFDLDAIGVIHQNDGPFRVTEAEVAGGDFFLKWESNPGSRYRIETSLTLDGSASWAAVEVVAGAQESGEVERWIPLDGQPRRFWRVKRLE